MGAPNRYTQDSKTCVLTHYDSIAAMEQDCLHKPMQRNRNILERRELERYGHGERWYGVASLDEVKRILVQGYPEGAVKVDELYENLAPSLPRAVEFRRRRVRSDQGDELDIHAVNRGALDKAWATTRRRPHHGSGLVRIAVDICGNGDVTADQLQWRGIAALALSRAMSKAGYSIELVAGQAGIHAFAQQSSLHGIITVTVKPRHVSIDTATLAASVCLPGFFRYPGFASIIRQSDDLGYDTAGGLGRAVKLETVLPVPEKIAQVVVQETVSTKESAAQWVKDAVSMLQGATVGKEQV